MIKLFLKITMAIATVSFGNTPTNCHVINRSDIVDGFNTTALDDVITRWLAEENGSCMRTFSILSRNWKKPGFISTNPCITVEMDADWSLSANFEKETD